jgi:hypothetical protein
MKILRLPSSAGVRAGYRGSPPRGSIDSGVLAYKTRGLESLETATGRSANGKSVLATEVGAAVPPSSWFWIGGCVERRKEETSPYSGRAHEVATGQSGDNSNREAVVMLCSRSAE